MAVREVKALYDRTVASGHGAAGLSWLMAVTLAQSGIPVLGHLSPGRIVSHSSESVMAQRSSEVITAK